MNAPLQTIESKLYATNAEQSVIGALLLDNESFERIVDLLPDHFYDAAHRDIFNAIVQMIMKNKPADVITIADYLRAKGSQFADVAFLHALQANTPSAANIARYASIVRDKAIKRGLVSLCREMSDFAETSSMDSSALVDQLSTKVEEIARKRVKNDPVLAADDLSRHIEALDEKYHGGGAKAISTGYPDIDAKLNGGIRPGQLIVVAGRPKMGKTAFALNLGVNIASDEKIAYSVLVCSMEMPISELHDRNLAVLGRMPLSHLLDPPQMTDMDWQSLTVAVTKMTDMKIFLDDQGGLRLMDVRMKAKQVKRRHGLNVLIIDYLQLMDAEGDNRNAQIESITRGLKALAKELGIAIILLSQLNRDLERRPNKRPQPSDLRDSGSIEQDADVVIFLYRDEVYNHDSMDKGICEVDVALNRQGASGRTALTYIGEQTRFENLQRSWSPVPPRSAPQRSRGFTDD